MTLGVGISAVSLLLESFFRTCFQLNTKSGIGGCMTQENNQNQKQNKKIYWFLLLTIILILSIFLSALTGSAGLSIWDSFRMFISEIPFFGKWVTIAETQTVYHKIVWEIRMPRIMMAGLTGYGLSVVGVAFQGIFKNPLADPHILGTSSGAALGATLAIMAGSVFPMTGLGLIGASIAQAIP